MSSEGAEGRYAPLPGSQSLDDILKAERARVRSENDCFSCKVMGTTAFTGLGIFSYISGHRELDKAQAQIIKSGSRIGMPARRLGTTMMSAVLVGLGIYRFYI